MAFDLAAEVLRRQWPSVHHQAVMFTYADFANAENHIAWIGFDTLSTMSQVSRRKCVLIRTELVEMGALLLVERGHGRGNANRHLLDPRAVPVKKKWKEIQERAQRMKGNHPKLPLDYSKGAQQTGKRCTRCTRTRKRTRRRAREGISGLV